MTDSALTGLLIITEQESRCYRVDQHTNNKHCFSYCQVNTYIPALPLFVKLGVTARTSVRKLLPRCPAFWFLHKWWLAMTGIRAFRTGDIFGHGAACCRTLLSSVSYMLYISCMSGLAAGCTAAMFSLQFYCFISAYSQALDKSHWVPIGGAFNWLHFWLYRSKVKVRKICKNYHLLSEIWNNPIFATTLLLTYNTCRTIRINPKLSLSFKGQKSRSQ